MSNGTRYLIWATGLCLLLSLLSLAMIAIGIKPLSIGIVATTCMLILATIVLFILSVRGVKKGKQK